MLDFIIIFIIIYLLYFLTIVVRKKGLEEFKKGKQVEFFKKVYKLDFRKINIKGFANSLALTSAFIVSLTCVIVMRIKGIVLQIIFGFGIVMILLIICYTILGKIYQKKEGKKNV